MAEDYVEEDHCAICGCLLTEEEEDYSEQVGRICYNCLVKASPFV